MPVIVNTPFKNLCIPWNDVNVGTSSALNSSYASDATLVSVENNKVIGLYRTSSNEVYAQSYVVSSNTFSVNATTLLYTGSGYSPPWGADRLDANSAVFVYRDSSTSKVQIVTAGSGTLVGGNIFNLGSIDTTFRADVAVLNSSKVAVINATFPDKDLTLRRMSVSGTTLSEDYATTLVGTKGGYGIERIDDTRVLTLRYVSSPASIYYDVYEAGASSWTFLSTTTSTNLSVNGTASMIPLGEDSTNKIFAVYSYSSNIPGIKKVMILTVNKSTNAITEGSLLDTGVLGTEYTRSYLVQPITGLSSRRFMITSPSTVHVIERGTTAPSYQLSVITSVSSLGNDMFTELSRHDGSLSSYSPYVFRRFGANAQVLTTC